jgi:hypothetical protein
MLSIADIGAYLRISHSSFTVPKYFSFSSSHADLLSFFTAPACSSAKALLWAKTFWLRSKTGRGHGTPVEAQTVMMARYLLTWLANIALLSADQGSKGNLPSHYCRHETEATTDSKEAGRRCQTLWGWIECNLPVRCRNEAVEDDQGKEEDDVGYIGA